MTIGHARDRAEPQLSPAPRTVNNSAANRLIGEVVQSRRRPLLGCGAFSLLKAATTAFTFKNLLRHYAKQASTDGK